MRDRLFMRMWVLILFGLAFAAEKPKTVQDCLQVLCDDYKKDAADVKLVGGLRAALFNFSTCVFYSAPDEEGNYPCKDLDTPTNVVFDCEPPKRNELGKCYTKELDMSQSCSDVLDKLVEFVTKSKKECESVTSRRRREASS